MIKKDLIILARRRCVTNLFCLNRLLNSGNPRNVPAGHSVNLDKVMEHYRQKHLAEEERKLKALEAERKLKAEQAKK